MQGSVSFLACHDHVVVKIIYFFSFMFVSSSWRKLHKSLTIAVFVAQTTQLICLLHKP
jgi:hypothetical protein